jgi:hypothetical protein
VQTGGMAGILRLDRNGISLFPSDQSALKAVTMPLSIALHSMA